MKAYYFLFSLFFLFFSGASFAQCNGRICTPDAEISSDATARQGQEQNLVYAPYSEARYTNHIQPLNPGYPDNYGNHLPRKQYSGNVWNPKNFVAIKRVFNRAELVRIAKEGDYDIYPQKIPLVGKPVSKIAIYILEALPPGEYSQNWPAITGFTENKNPTQGLIARVAIEAMDHGANILWLLNAGGDREFTSDSVGTGASLSGSFFIDSAKELLGAMGAIAGFSRLKAKHKDEGWVQAIPIFYQPLTDVRPIKVSDEQKQAECSFLNQNPLFKNSHLFGCK